MLMEKGFKIFCYETELSEYVKGRIVKMHVWLKRPFLLVIRNRKIGISFLLYFVSCSESYHHLSESSLLLWIKYYFYMSKAISIKSQKTTSFECKRVIANCQKKTQGGKLK
jgi:hypothetical protein